MVAAAFTREKKPANGGISTSQKRWTKKPTRIGTWNVRTMNILQIKEKNYGWIGHTLRKNKGEISYKALLWNNQGKRRVGAPQRSWRNTISRETCGKSIAELSYLANVDKSKIGAQRNLKMLTRETAAFLRKMFCEIKKEKYFVWIIGK